MNLEDFLIQNEKDWKKIHNDIFGETIPEHWVWTNVDDIIAVLNKIGSVEASNHMFFPDSGGLDLEGAKRSNERGAIELLTGISYIVKPTKLVFEKIDENLEWNYFRLETDGLKPSGVYEEYPDDFPQEEVVELYNGHYIERHFWDEEVYHDEPLPGSARIVVRYFKGSFVIFKKTSIYNNNPSTYDGRHDKLGEEGFKEYIKAAYEHLSKRPQNEN
jgi:hypothetical protein